MKPTKEDSVRSLLVVLAILAGCSAGSREPPADTSAEALEGDAFEVVIDPGPADPHGPDADGSGGDDGAAEPSCTSDSQCDNGVFCDGAERCIEGACAPGIPPCDDGVACTLDACNEDTNACSSLPDHGACETAGEFCSPSAGCVPRGEERRELDE